MVPGVLLTLLAAAHGGTTSGSTRQGWGMSLTGFLNLSDSLQPDRYRGRMADERNQL